jgi:hypothetical protein
LSAATRPLVWFSFSTMLRFALASPIVFFFGICVLGPSAALGVDDFDLPPIRYTESTPHNAVQSLLAKLASGELKLDYHEEFGYLPAVLEQLDVSQESQVLVFSKTSLQFRRIEPQRPRALYFNDDIYVGYCRAGEVMEISVADPRLGAVFYTVDQRRRETSRLTRQTDTCLACHSSVLTGGVPGHLVRSVYPDAEGELIFSKGTIAVDHTTPLAKRWGGWYVTGTHGVQTHLGNVIYQDDDDPEPNDERPPVTGHNVLRLDDRFATEHYLTPHSDIVALMVLEHQVLVHNRLTFANFDARSARHYQLVINRAMEEPLDAPLESVTHRMEAAAEKLVDALLFVGEARLTAPLVGSTDYAKQFAAQGPRDSQGRSLRDLDLTTRMFKHPCSYLIYSDSFRQLPKRMRLEVWRRLGAVLSGADQSPKFAPLTVADRQAIGAILRETHPDVPSEWPGAKEL